MTTRALAPRDTFEQYMSEVNRIPLLSRQEEEELTTEFASSGDPAIAHRLVVSNLRFVVRIANEYRGYGLKLIDLVQEGNLGLMIAVQKFDHARGYRLISYAVWWIRAYIQAYVMRSVSMVKLGTTQAQRKLFFGRRKARAKLIEKGSEPTRENMAEMLGVTLKDVDEMEMRLAGKDFSLDAPMGSETGANSMIDLLQSSDDDSPEELVADKDLKTPVKGKENPFMLSLSPKNLKSDEAFFTNVEKLHIPYAGYLDYRPIEGIKYDGLVRT